MAAVIITLYEGWLADLLTMFVYKCAFEIWLTCIFLFVIDGTNFAT